VQRAHDLVNAPKDFWRGDRLQSSGFSDRPGDHRNSGNRHQERARAFNATSWSSKWQVVLFVIALGIRYVNFANWGSDWALLRAHGFSGIGAGAAYIFFAYIGFDAVTTTAQEAKNPQRGTCPSASSSRCWSATTLYILVAGVLTGMVRWQDVTRSAHCSRVPGSRPIDGLAHHYARRSGRLDQRDAGDAARANPRPLFHGQRWTPAAQIFCRRASQSFRTPWKNTIVVGLLAAIVGSVTPI